MKAISKKQIKVLLFIAEYIAKKGYPPAIRDISGHYGFTVRVGYEYVLTLERKGLITTELDNARSIRITDEGKDIIGGHGIIGDAVYEQVKFK